jgi:hypothetical protein
MHPWLLGRERSLLVTGPAGRTGHRLSPGKRRCGRPPFRPHAIIDVVREAIRRPNVTNPELTSMVGLRKLNPGQEAMLVLACLREGATFAEQAAGFRVGRTTAWRHAARSSPYWRPGTESPRRRAGGEKGRARLRDPRRHPRSTGSPRTGPSNRESVQDPAPDQQNGQALTRQSLRGGSSTSAVALSGQRTPAPQGGVSADQRPCVARERIELPTFRFSGQPRQALCRPAKTNVTDNRNRARRKVRDHASTSLAYGC